MKIRLCLLSLCCGMTLTAMARADESIVVMRSINADGVGAIIGLVKLSDTEKGLAIDPDLGELSPGPHGFHVHQNPSCEAAEKDGSKVAGLAAGGHYDPHGAGAHAGPEGKGHAGDLPALDVNENGEAVRLAYAPHLKLSDIRGRALIIHAGGDNYSDNPKPLGGGGARIACGIIE